ncbi:hypothetical protein DLAC_10264 [Tieghemostelium lacteum]|uniref:B box-type domain-containing protein n=1 Tax=Tieghemostelium lacteum TaxID=361077 RepID=A0A151Z503_TIELA|nr:hypothetical protein DLAC_10264 [Tieghemostelium lacteum]|eukprot:KYQ89040.1 hypothetical protein DLAC_10264 [Tieghemostelium lacteum]
MQDEGEKVTECADGYHLKPISLYCDNNCKTTVCTKCAYKHKHHELFDFEDVYCAKLNKSKEYLATIQQQINNKTQQKILNEEVYKIEVQLHHETQLDIINKHFKELHDQLHFKELELKRELKSYFDDNTESFIESTSKLDYQIQKFEQFLSLHQQLIDSSIVDVDGSDGCQTRQEDQQQQIEFLENFNQVLREIEKRDGLDFLKFKAKLNSMESEIQTMKLVQMNPRNVYLYNFLNNHELERVDIINNTSESLKNTSKVTENNSYCINDVLFEDKLYHMVNGKYYTLTVKPFCVPKFENGDFYFQKNYVRRSAVFDEAKEIVYYCVGFIDKVKKGIDIYSIDINTMGKKLILSLNDNVFIDKIYGGLDKTKETLYVVQSDTQTLQTRIDIVNLVTKQSKCEIVLADEHCAASLLDEINEKIYIVTAKGVFGLIVYDIKTSKVTKLADPPLALDNLKFKYFKLHLNNNIITFQYQYTDPDYLFKYRIYDDKWDKVKIIKIVK